MYTCNFPHSEKGGSIQKRLSVEIASERSPGVRTAEHGNDHETVLQVFAFWIPGTEPVSLWVQTTAKLTSIIFTDCFLRRTGKFDFHSS